MKLRLKHHPFSSPGILHKPAMGQEFVVCLFFPFSQLIYLCYLCFLSGRGQSRERGEEGKMTLSLGWTWQWLKLESPNGVCTWSQLILFLWGNFLGSSEISYWVPGSFSSLDLGQLICILRDHLWHLLHPIVYLKRVGSFSWGLYTPLCSPVRIKRPSRCSSSWPTVVHSALMHFLSPHYLRSSSLYAAAPSWLHIEAVAFRSPRWESDIIHKPLDHSQAWVKNQSSLTLDCRGYFNALQ